MAKPAEINVPSTMDFMDSEVYCRNVSFADDEKDKKLVTQN